MIIVFGINVSLEPRSAVRIGKVRLGHCRQLIVLMEIMNNNVLKANKCAYTSY